MASSVDKELLRNFYFSKAQDFSKYQKAKVTQDTTTPSPVKTKGTKKGETITAAGPQPASGTVAALPAPTANLKASTTAPVASNRLPPIGGGDGAVSEQPKPNAAALTPIPTKATKATPTTNGALTVVETSNALDTTASTTAAPNSAHSVTSEYLTFIKQQQDLQKHHNLIEHTVTLLKAHVNEQVQSVNGVRAIALSTLGEAEGSANWNLQSKYTATHLIQDAGMTLSLTKLLGSGRSAPSTVELQHHIGSFTKLKQDHAAKGKYQAHKLVVENLLRRLERSVKELLACTPEVDAASVAKILDHYYVHLDHVMSSPTMEERCVKTNELIEHLMQKHAECIRSRDESLDDGDMVQAERFSYMQLEVLEELVAAVIDKIRIVTTCLEENAVNDKVQTNYATSTKEFVTKVKTEQGELKDLCENDLKRLFELRTRVDALEAKATKRLEEERSRLDQWLENNAKDQTESWNSIFTLMDRIVQLERDRHDVIKVRLDEKQKQEQRVREYKTFCDVADTHARLLDATMKTCESTIHSCNVLGDSVDAGFHALHVEFKKLDEELTKVLLDTQTAHYDSFRNLYFSLGDLLLKRDKKIEEIDTNIQAAHIQQELCTESLNPNAKKFSDMKRDLLQLREELERDIGLLKQRAAAAVEGYNPTEEALSKIMPDYQSPVEEQEDRRLQQRARMLEYKALSIGNVEAAPIRDEIKDLQRQLNTSKKMVGM
eukprot:PhF_6_TR40211/c0_g1_i3/m.59712